MEGSEYLYYAVAVVVAGIMIWGRLEWYAAILLGFISPLVGAVLTMPLSLLLGPVLPPALVESGYFSVVVAFGLVIVGAFLLARNLRKNRYGRARSGRTGSPGRQGD